MTYHPLFRSSIMSPYSISIYRIEASINSATLEAEEAILSSDNRENLSLMTCRRFCRRLLQFKSEICDSKLMTVERPGNWSAYGVSVRTEEASSA